MPAEKGERRRHRRRRILPDSNDGSTTTTIDEYDEEERILDDGTCVSTTVRIETRAKVVETKLDDGSVVREKVTTTETITTTTAREILMIGRPAVGAAEIMATTREEESAATCLLDAFAGGAVAAMVAGDCDAGGGGGGGGGGGDAAEEECNAASEPTFEVTTRKGDCSSTLGDRTTTPTTTTTNAMSVPASFFRKTHPGVIGGDRARDNDREDSDVGLDDLRGVVASRPFALYESDRCETRLPAHGDATRRRGRVRRSPPPNNMTTANVGRGEKKKDTDLDPYVAGAVRRLREKSMSPMRRDNGDDDDRIGRGRRAGSAPQTIIRQRRGPSPAQQQLTSLRGRQTSARQSSRPTAPNRPRPVTSITSPGAGHDKDSGQSSNSSNDGRSPNRGRIGLAPPNSSSGAPADFDALPLGRLANPIRWDARSETRDDLDTVGGTSSQVEVVLGEGKSPGCAPPSPSSATKLPSIPGEAATGSSGRRRLVMSLQPKSTRRRGRSGSRRKTKTDRPSRSASASTPKADDERSADENPTVSSAVVPPAALVKYKQALLPRGDARTFASDPKIAIHGDNAVIASDESVHFYRFRGDRWSRTTVVGLRNASRGISLALHGDTAVVGAPYDLNSKGVVTGSAYIFERDAESRAWFQVKKIVPKRAREHATAGYDVDVCNNVVAVGVPALGATWPSAASGEGGVVYVYQRADRFRWVPMGRLAAGDGGSDGSPATAAACAGFGAVVSLRGKTLVVGNGRRPDGRHPSEASLFVYEYDASYGNKWRPTQTDLLSTEGERRRFGSHVALTADGDGIFVGCHSEVSPTEVLYYRRKGQKDVHGNRRYRLQQIVTVQERCGISNLWVDGNDTFVLGTLHSNRVHVYQQLYDLSTMEYQGWSMVCKVVNTADRKDNIENFGLNVGLHGDNVLVGSKGNVYSYSLEGWRAAMKNKRTSKLQHRSSSRLLSSSPSRRFMSSMSPLKLRR